jgi:hypothetical protein
VQHGPDGEQHTLGRSITRPSKLGHGADHSDTMPNLPTLAMVDLTLLAIGVGVLGVLLWTGRLFQRPHRGVGVALVLVAIGLAGFVVAELIHVWYWRGASRSSATRAGVLTFIGALASAAVAGGLVIRGFAHHDRRELEAARRAKMLDAAEEFAGNISRVASAAYHLEVALKRSHSLGGRNGRAKRKVESHSRPATEEIDGSLLPSYAKVAFAFDQHREDFRPCNAWRVKDKPRIKVDRSSTGHPTDTAYCVTELSTRIMRMLGEHPEQGFDIVTEVYYEGAPLPWRTVLRELRKHFYSEAMREIECGGTPRRRRGERDAISRHNALSTSEPGVEKNRTATSR